MFTRTVDKPNSVAYPEGNANGNLSRRCITTPLKRITTCTWWGLPTVVITHDVVTKELPFSPFTSYEACIVSVVLSVRRGYVLSRHCLGITQHHFHNVLRHCECSDFPRLYHYSRCRLTILVNINSVAISGICVQDIYFCI